MCSDQPDSNTMSDVLVLQCEPAATPGNTDTDIESLVIHTTLQTNSPTVHLARYVTV